MGTDKFWVEHASLLYVLTILMFGFVCYLIKMVINQSIKNMETVCNSISDLYGKYNSLERNLSLLQGEHHAVQEGKLRRATDRHNRGFNIVDENE